MTSYDWIYIVILAVVGTAVVCLIIMGVILWVRRRRLARLYRMNYLGRGMGNFHALAGPNWQALIKDESVLRRINQEGPDPQMRAQIEKYGIRIKDYNPSENVYNVEACPVCLISFQSSNANQVAQLNPERSPVPEQKNIVGVMRCQHILHIACMQQLVLINYAKCPVCSKLFLSQEEEDEEDDNFQVREAREEQQVVVEPVQIPVAGVPYVYPVQPMSQPAAQRNIQRFEDVNLSSITQNHEAI